MAPENIIDVIGGQSSLEKSPLQQLDSIIQENRRQEVRDDGKRLRNLAQLAMLSVAGETFEDCEDIDKRFIAVLDAYKEIEQQKLLAACILRLLPESAMKWLSRNPFRPKIVTLLGASAIYWNCLPT